MTLFGEKMFADVRSLPEVVQKIYSGPALKLCWNLIQLAHAPPGVTCCLCGDVTTGEATCWHVTIVQEELRT